MNEKEIPPNTLIHHGVKGMKWGVRRSQAALDRAAGRRRSSDAEAASAAKRKRVSQLSNNELKSLNTRLNLEQNYRRMNPSSITRGKNLAKGALGAATAGVTVYNMVKSPAGQAAINGGKTLLRRYRTIAG